MTCVSSWEDSPAYFEGSSSSLNQIRLVASARRTLRRRALFGLFERYNESVALINARLRDEFAGHPLGSLQLPPPSKSPLPRRLNLSAEALSLVRRHSAADVALYEQAKEMWERELRAHPIA